MPRLSPLEWSYAQAGAFATRHKGLREFLHGPASPRTTLIDFHLARTTRDNVALTVMHGHNVEEGSYQSSWPVHILVASAAAIHAAMQPERGETLGYAWNTRSLGRAVLVGEIPEDELPEPGAPLAVGVSVGAETTNGGLVVVRPGRTLVSLGEDQTPANAGLPHLAPVYNLPMLVPLGIHFY